MTVDGQLVAPSAMDSLLARLDEPRVVAALNDLLDHVDLLAVLVQGFDGFFRRGDVISDTIAEAVAEFRGAGANGLGDTDLPRLAASLGTLSTAMADATPALTTLLRSDMVAPTTIEFLAAAARAVRLGAEAAKAEQVRVRGAFSLLRTLKDDDVARGLGVLLQMLRALGKEIEGPGEDSPR